MTIIPKRENVNTRLVRYSLECLHKLSFQHKATNQLLTLANEYKTLFKDNLLDYCTYKDPQLKPKYDEFCRNINFNQK